MDMEMKVKGTIFSEYIRMLKKRKDIDWGRHLTPEDLAYIEEPILPSSWYPFETYKRMGLAVFKEIAGDDPKLAWLWGRASVDGLLKIYKNLVRENDPAGTLKSFTIIRRQLTSFEWLEINEAGPNNVQMKFKLSLGKEADRAYAHHLGGMFERLIELAGGKAPRVEIVQKSWSGDPGTAYELSWE